MRSSGSHPLASLASPLISLEMLPNSLGRLVDEWPKSPEPPNTTHSGFHIASKNVCRTAQPFCCKGAAVCPSIPTNTNEQASGAPVSCRLPARTETCLPATEIDNSNASKLLRTHVSPTRAALRTSTRKDFSSRLLIERRRFDAEFKLIEEFLPLRFYVPHKSRAIHLLGQTPRTTNRSSTFSP